MLQRERAQETTAETLYPIQWVQVGNLSKVPAPLARITLCGNVQLEVLREVVNTEPPQARYDVVAFQEQGKGSSTALNLLKLLASLPGHAATRDWLSEHLPSSRMKKQRGEDDEEEGDGRGLERVDNVVTLLRKLLCPPEIAGSKILRPLLVALLRNHRDSGSGYQLAAAPLLWLDVDVMATAVQQACQWEQEGQDALAGWEAVYALGCKGRYLPLEIYSDWAEDKRAEVDGYLKQAVLALRRLLLIRYREAGEERVLALLRSYWQQHKTDEDALRPLLELLGKHERYQEAEDYYQQLRLALAELGHDENGRLPEPDARTCDMREYLRTRQLRRNIEGDIFSLPQSIPSSIFPLSVLSPAPVTGEPLITTDQESVLFASSFGTSKNEVILPDALSIGFVPTEPLSTDCAIWFGGKQAQLVTFIVQWRKHAIFCHELQEQLDQEITMFDQVRPLFDDQAKYSLSRRQVLISIAMLPVALLKVTQQGNTAGLDMEEFLPRCAASITAVYHLLKGRDFLTVNEVLSGSLPILFSLSRKPSPYQQTAAQLAAQSCLLMSLMSRHRGNNLALDEWYCREAVFSSEMTTNLLLKIATLKQLADTYYYREQYSAMLLAYEKAWYTITAAPHLDDTPSLLRARVYAGLAYACVKNGDVERAKSLLSLARETFPLPVPVADDRVPLYADCGIHSLYLWGGLTHRLLNQSDDAEKTFALVEQLPARNILVPERTRVEIVTQQAATAIAQGNMEAFCSYFIAAINDSMSIQSEKRRQEAIKVYQQARERWPNEMRIRNLAHQFVLVRD